MSIASVYIAEISSKDLRGSLTNVLNITQCLGLILTFSLSLVVTWRSLAWLLAAPMLLTVLGMWTLPETPYWLAEKNRLEDRVPPFLNLIYEECSTLGKKSKNIAFSFAFLRFHTLEINFE